MFSFKRDAYVEMLIFWDVDDDIKTLITMATVVMVSDRV